MRVGPSGNRERSAYVVRQPGDVEATSKRHPRVAIAVAPALEVPEVGYEVPLLVVALRVREHEIVAKMDRIS